MENSENEITYIEWTFRAGMHQTTPANKERYSALKNKLLAFKNADGKPVRNTEYRRFSIFYDTREIIAKITLRQNMLKIYFPADMIGDDGEQVTGAAGEEAAADGSTPQNPLTDADEAHEIGVEWREIKLKTKKAFDEAMRLIDAVAEKRGLSPNPKYVPQDFAEKFPTLSNIGFLRRRKKSDDSLRPAEPESEIEIEAIGLTSCEHYSDEGTLKPLLRDIELEIHRGEIVGIGGNDDNEVRVLCEILGNMRPYYKGYLKLGPMGVKKDKRVVLEHTFYVDNDEMLYGRMTVLEQLLFSVNLSKKHENPIKRQREMLDTIVQNGLREFALTKIRDLTRSQRIIIALFMAGISDSRVIVANLLDYSFSQDEVEILQKTMAFIKSREKTVIFATLQPKLIGMTCTEVVFLYQGKVEYCGTVKGLTEKYDKVVCLLRCDRKEELIGYVAAEMPGYGCSIEDDMLLVSNYNNAAFDEAALYRLLEKHGIKPDMIKLNRGRVENSFRELMVKYDL